MSFWHDGSRAFHWSNVLIRASFRYLSEGLPRVLGVREIKLGFKTPHSKASRAETMGIKQKKNWWGGVGHRGEKVVEATFLRCQTDCSWAL